MKMSPFLPQNHAFAYTNEPTIKPLTHDITTDVVIIGGGMTGLTAAQEFNKRGAQVVLLEKNFCGSGATGKSSGFVTPNAELALSDLMRLYGQTEAQDLWCFVTSGVDTIRTNIETYELDCDYQKQDTLVVANTERALEKELHKEHILRKQLNYDSTWYTKQELTHILASDDYKGGVSYGNSFGIQPYRYCHGMKHILQENGVQIYEETPVIEIQDKMVKTPSVTVHANYIIVCTDYAAHGLKSMYDKIYHVQTYVMLSAPLTEHQINNIFPHDNYMTWDTSLVYNYYRLMGDNRLILGGSSLFHSYVTKEIYNSTYVIEKLTKYFRKKFPTVNVSFEYIWPGLIGITKDILPIVGYDHERPSIYYAVGATGLPWAAAIGTYSAQAILENNTRFDLRFSPYRSFKLGKIAQTFLGTRLTFALSNFLQIGSI